MKPSLFHLITSVLAVSGSQLHGATVLNPSFEERGSFSNLYHGMGLANWSPVINSQGKKWGIEASSSTLLASGGLPSDGVRFGYLYRSTFASTIQSGEFISISQTIDLSDVLSIKFDAALVHVENSTLQSLWANSLEAQLLINGVVYWRSTETGFYLDQTVNTSGLNGSLVVSE